MDFLLFFFHSFRCCSNVHTHFFFCSGKKKNNVGGLKNNRKRRPDLSSSSERPKSGSQASSRKVKVSAGLSGLGEAEPDLRRPPGSWLDAGEERRTTHVSPQSNIFSFPPGLLGQDEIWAQRF